MKHVRHLLVGSLALVVLVSAPALASTGAAKNDKQAAAQIRRSVDATQDMGTAALEGVVKIESNDVNTTLHLDGAVELGPTGDGVMHYEAGSLFASDIEARFVDGVLYMDVGPILGMTDEDLPEELEGISWMALDLTDAVNAEQQGAAPPGSSNPASQLDLLRGVVKGSIETVGVETINGAETTHYRAEVDADKVRAQAPKGYTDQFSDIEGFEEALAAFEDYPVDVWLDADGVVRRERMRMNVTVNGETVTESVSFDYVEFGVPVEVEAPPADEIITFRDLLKLAEQLDG